MKISEKILLVTVFLSLLPVANLFALTQEAKDAIEVLRSRISVKEEQQIEEKEYIPGVELSAALVRYKQKFHTNLIKPATKEPEENIIVVTTPEIRVIDQTDNESFSEIVSDLVQKTENQLNSIASNKKNYQDMIESIRARVKARESLTYTADIEMISADEISENQENIKNQIEDNPKPINDEEYIPGLLLEKSVEKFRQSNNKTTSKENLSIVENNQQNSKVVMEKANQEIEELFNNPDKRAQIAEKGRNKKADYNKAKIIEEPEVKEDDEKQIDDDKFNDYISRYNFKMPENYRIIVE